MYALDLSGANIGHPITYSTVSERPNHPVVERTTDEITMILHKKNGRVVVRHGRNNRQVTLHPLTEILAVV